MMEFASIAMSKICSRHSLGLEPATAQWRNFSSGTSCLAGVMVTGEYGGRDGDCQLPKKSETDREIQRFTFSSERKLDSLSSEKSQLIPIDELGKPMTRVALKPSPSPSSLRTVLRNALCSPLPFKEHRWIQQLNLVVTQPVPLCSLPVPSQFSCKTS
jgi:hypothetical protein